MGVFKNSAVTSKYKKPTNKVLPKPIPPNVSEDFEYKSLFRKTSNDLFMPVPNDYEFLPPRWPLECEVVQDQIFHINCIPQNPENFYCPTGKEDQPKVCENKRGVVVYDYLMSSLHFFHKSSANGTPREINSAHPNLKKDSLRFESRFECGNLAKVVQIHETYYELYLRSDLYTNKHVQWFYFKVTNMTKNVNYRFTIVNLTKEESLYKQGMKPLMYSVKDAFIRCVGWRRCGDNISYHCNNNCSETNQEQTYSFTFTFQFTYDGDAVYFTYCYPYTYSDLQLYLFKLVSHPIKAKFTNVRLLCKSLAGNNVYYLSITAPETSSAKKKSKYKNKGRSKTKKKKRTIVVTSRVHAGETPSSWIMKGILDFLTSNSSTAKKLRENFIFKLVPMLNPDGVVVGNTRLSLTGKDLNRQYKNVVKNQFPSIWYTKLLIERISSKENIAMYCDLHAHSRSHNIFLYGRDSQPGSDEYLEAQMFPLLLHRNAVDKFSYESCQFNFGKRREGTGREVMEKMGISHSFTIEASFGGSKMGDRNETLFSTQDYEEMGHSFCKTVLDFYDEDPFKEKMRRKLRNRLRKDASDTTVSPPPQDVHDKNK
ncbi:hypothetical protein FQA39_LY02110 [Lamprigera yunnana]|nr:hypothetical protein FQA39_LY02110 [Lamprigera yunnana]